MHITNSHTENVTCFLKSSPTPLKSCLRVQAAVDSACLEAPAQLAYPETAMILETRVSEEAGGLGSSDTYCSYQEMLKADRQHQMASCNLD